MADPRRHLGAHAEALVADRLLAEGWTVIDRNFRTRFGEIDLIAMQGRQLVFIEVKSGRVGNRLGPERPVFAVGRQKQQRLRQLAREWLSQNRPPSGCSSLRFDVVGVTYSRAGEPLDLEHIEDAF